MQSEGSVENQPNESKAPARIRSFSFQELAKNFAEIEAKVKQFGEDVPEEYYQMHEVSKHLLAGKLDEVWKLKKAIEAHNEALRDQMDKNDQMLQDIDYFVEEAVKASPDKLIEGLTTKAKLVRNPRGKVVVHDEAKIPANFKKHSFSWTENFPQSDSDRFLFLASVVLGKVVFSELQLTREDREKLSEYFSETVSKSEVEKAFKAGEVVPGAEYVHGYRLSFDAGKRKIKAGEGDVNE
jgi:hypothetical protein